MKTGCSSTPSRSVSQRQRKRIQYGFNPGVRFWRVRAESEGLIILSCLEWIFALQTQFVGVRGGIPPLLIIGSGDDEVFVWEM